MRLAIVGSRDYPDLPQDGASRGTRHTLTLARTAGRPLVVRMTHWLTEAELRDAGL